MIKKIKKKVSDKEKSEEKSSSSVRAKKDFVISFNDYHREIKEGDDLSDVPEMFIQNLKTENVI